MRAIVTIGEFARSAFVKSQRRLAAVKSAVFSARSASDMRAGDTLLVDAAHEERAADVAALLADGADVDEMDETGWTSLCFACFKGNLEIVTTLLAASAAAAGGVKRCWHKQW